MKKLFALVIVFALVVGLLTGCSGGGKYKITDISSDKNFIQECPKSANPGDEVTIVITTVTDAISYVRINEDPDFGEFVDYCTYVFIMPECDVTVKAGFTTQGVEGGAFVYNSGEEDTEGGTEEDFNILDNLWENSDGSKVYLYGNDFLLTMLNTGEWAYEQMQPNSFTIYHIPSRNSGFDGTLVTIAAYDLDDSSYTVLPDYNEAGIGQNACKRFIAIFPTDLRTDPTNDEIATSYASLSEYLSHIGEGGENDPFQTSDSD